MFVQGMSDQLFTRTRLTRNQYVYIAPTSEVIRSIALTDNVAYPWFAPAGYNRGTVSGAVVRADVKLNQTDRDVCSICLEERREQQGTIERHRKNCLDNDEKTRKD